MINCKKCNKECDGSFGSGKFCSSSCANSRQKQKKIIKCITCELEFSVALTSKRKFCSVICSDKKKMIKSDNKKLFTLWGISSRTRAKILSRINKGCSRCGWNEAACDLHHINGKKIENPHSLSNLTLLCPNCHRLYHSKKIGPSDVISLDKYIDDLTKYYYG